MMSDDDRISGREAADLLASRGLSLMATQHLLATGIAGRPIVTRSAHLYDRTKVVRLAAAQEVARHEFADVCPHGYLVTRLPRAAHYGVDDAWNEQRAVLRGPWRIGRTVLIVLAARLYRDGSFPMVLTASGFVVGGGEVTAIAGGGQDDPRCTVVFDVVSPGAWLDAFVGRRCAPGRGPQLLLRGWPRSPPS